MKLQLATLSEMLKKVFGWSARTTGDGSDGIVEFTERGPAAHNIWAGTHSCTVIEAFAMWD